METNKNEYQHGKIYRVSDIGYNKFYYGSTIQTLAKRMGGHRKDYKMYKEGKRKNALAVFLLFDEFGVGNCKIELVEQFPCNCRTELERREGFHTQTNECVNKYIAGRTSKELYEQCRDVILKRVQDYYQRKKETILAKQKEQYHLNPEVRREHSRHYYSNHKENKGQYQQQYYETHKDKCLGYGREYREKNKDQLSHQAKDYYIRNREKILERCKVRVCCDVCGITFTKSDKSKHIITQKHQEALKHQEPETEP